MPSLMPTKWTPTHPTIPRVWSCSECNAAFDMGPIFRAAPTPGQVEQVNRLFEIHCKHSHPEQTFVIGLRRPEPATCGHAHQKHEGPSSPRGTVAV
jgi:hypothetical protein